MGLRKIINQCLKRAKDSELKCSEYTLFPRLIDQPITNEYTETEEYIFKVSSGIRVHCSDIDPFGECCVEDCLSCENARVRITRVADNCVLREE